jgi:hypothetical protein
MYWTGLPTKQGVGCSNHPGRTIPFIYLGSGGVSRLCHVQVMSTRSLEHTMDLCDPREGQLCRVTRHWEFSEKGSYAWTSWRVLSDCSDSGVGPT